MTTTTPAPTMDLDRQLKRGLPLLPLFVLVPVAFALVFYAAGYGLSWRGFGLGALGWTIALLLRGPISAIGLKLPKERAQTLVIAASGPLEEGARLILLLLTGSGFSWALSVGQGWAAVEVLYTIIQVIALASLSGRTDEKALQAKQLLEAQGIIHGSPFWGVMERVSASALHIGFTLLVARYHWLVIAFIPLHSIVNLFAMRLAKQSLLRMELTLAVIGSSLLVAGLLVH